MSQKGLAPILIIVGIVIILGIVGGAYFLGKQFKPANPAVNPKEVTLTPAEKIVSPNDPEGWNCGKKAGPAGNATCPAGYSCDYTNASDPEIGTCIKISDQTSTSGNLFDVEKAKIGDKIGNMTITKLSGGKSDTPTANYATVSFSGKETVSGKITYYPTGGFMGEAICMDRLSADSLSKIPKMINDTRDVWFCFNNLDEAREDLNNLTQATVIINNYTIKYYPTEVYNTADLVAIK